MTETATDWEANTDETESNLNEDLEVTMQLFLVPEQSTGELIERWDDWKGGDSESWNKLIYAQLPIPETDSPPYTCGTALSQSDDSQSDISQPDLSELYKLPLDDCILDVSLPNVSLTDTLLSDVLLRYRRYRTKKRTIRFMKK